MVTLSLVVSVLPAEKNASFPSTVILPVKVFVPVGNVALPATKVRYAILCVVVPVNLSSYVPDKSVLNVTP